MPATLSQVSISLAVTVVATREVVPWRATVAAMISSASRGAFHHIVPAGAMDVDIDKSRHHGFPRALIFARAARQFDLPALAYGGDLASLDDDDGIGDFFEWGEGAVGVDGNRLHRGGIILLETRRIGEQVLAAKTSRPQEVSERRL